MGNKDSEGRYASHCGITCICPSWVDLAIALFGASMIPNMNVMNSYIKRPIICVSFFGLDKPTMMPPNITMTGPLLKPENSDLLDILREKNEDLYNWLEDAH